MNFGRFGHSVMIAAMAVVAAPAQAEHPYSYADLPGVRVAYVDTGGAGEAVVLVHALAGTSRHWEYQIDAFADAGYRVVAYDRRGWGDSIADPVTGEQPGT